MENIFVRICKKVEGHVWFRLIEKILEWGWVPLLAFAYVVWKLVAARPLDYSILAFFGVLCVVSFVYAFTLHRATVGASSFVRNASPGGTPVDHDRGEPWELDEAPE